VSKPAPTKPATVDPLAAERAAAAEAAKQIRYAEPKQLAAVPLAEKRIPYAKKPSNYLAPIIAGAHANDFTIPYDPASLTQTQWRGFVICEDKHGTRYVPVQMTYAQLQEVWRDEIVAWDTRVSQAERIEREFTSDVFTLKQGCWAERSPREQFSVWAKRRADGDKAPSHYMSHLIRTKLTASTVREVFAELAAAGFLGHYTPGDSDALTTRLLASLTVV
jgi:hypothetical protein